MRRHFFSKRTKPTARRPQLEVLALPSEVVARSSKSIDLGIVSSLEAIGQAWHKVIICRGEEGFLYAVDQHAAHERIRYEYMRALLDAPLLEIPHTHSFSLRQAVWEVEGGVEVAGVVKVEERDGWFDSQSQNMKCFGVENIIAIFEKYGIEYTRNSTHLQLYVKRKPLFFGKIDIVEILKKSSSVDEFNKMLDDRIREHACKGAIKFNDSLTNPQIKMIIKDLKLCRFPLFCIHGRNTIYPLN